jgi:putative endonuclease
MSDAFVYVVASGRNGTLYVGVTTDLIGRVYQHKNNLTPGFTSHYKCHDLVFYERHTSVYEAIRREKQIKAW